MCNITLSDLEPSDFSLSLRRSKNGSIFCEALAAEYQKAIDAKEAIDVEKMSFRINERLSKVQVPLVTLFKRTIITSIQIRVAADIEPVGQISQVKHQLSQRLMICDGNEFSVPEYDENGERVLILIGDTTCLASAVIYKVLYTLSDREINPVLGHIRIYGIHY